MNKILLGLLLGSVLGALDGLSAQVTASHDPEIRAGMVGIIIGSTFKGLIAGILIGAFARKVRSMKAGLIFGASVGAVLAATISFMMYLDQKPPYWLEIVLPGTVVGLIVGYATQKYGKAAVQRT